MERGLAAPASLWPDIQLFSLSTRLPLPHSGRQHGLAGKERGSLYSSQSAAQFPQGLRARGDRSNQAPTWPCKSTCHKGDLTGAKGQAGRASLRGCLRPTE